MKRSKFSEEHTTARFEKEGRKVVEEDLKVKVNRPLLLEWMGT